LLLAAFCMLWLLVALHHQGLSATMLLLIAAYAALIVLVPRSTD
jgi:hypothetical protein